MRVIVFKYLPFVKKWIPKGKFMGTKFQYKNDMHNSPNNRPVAILLIVLLFSGIPGAMAQVGIGTTIPDTSAQLDVSSTSKGFLPPRLTGAQRNGIASPAAGLIIYCTDCGTGGQIQFFNGSAWANMINGTSVLPIASKQGADIDGEAASDQSGYSVSSSADGSRVAIGAPQNDGNGSNSGQVRVYEWNGASWIQLGSDINGEAAFDQSGWSVSLSADGARVAIGAPLNAGNGSSAGQVRVYEWNGINWIQLGVDMDGEAAGDQSGWSVSLSSDGSRVAIGAPQNDGTAISAGHTRIYQWNGTNWTQLGIDIDGESGSDQSGYSVSLSSDGNRIVAGAPFNAGAGSNSGHVRVYQWNGTSWVQLGADINGEAAQDQAGWSVSVSSDGSRIAIGAPQNDGSGSNAGHVRIYQWNGAIWNQSGLDINGEQAGDFSGTSVSISADGNRIAIGGNLNDGGGTDAGHVRIYQLYGGSWSQVWSDIDGEAAGDWSGWSVSLSSNGRRLAIGATQNDGTGSNAGHARVFNQ